MTKLQIVYSSTLDDHALLAERSAFLKNEGFELSCLLSPTGENMWPYSYAAQEKRANAFMKLLSTSPSNYYLFARGGYGASDLLEHIDWQRLEQLPRAGIVGFSDVCTLLSAFYTRLGWKALHAPMPGSKFWGQNGSKDVEVLLSHFHNEPQPVALSLMPLNELASKASANSLEGWLFGGCLSVLSNLIATPYLPRDFAGAILFFEDVNEHPGRILRYFNQWRHAGLLDGVRAIVLGQLRECQDEGMSEAQLKGEIALRCNLPVFSSADFGHCSPNFPLELGAPARIAGSELVTSC